MVGMPVMFGPPQRYEEFAEELAVVLDVRRPGQADLPAPQRYVTREQLGSYPGREYLSVGSHAMTHYPLVLLNARERERELRDSHDVLAASGCNYNATMSYPYGSHDADCRKAVAGIYKAGFAVLAAQDPQPVRIPTHGADGGED